MSFHLISSKMIALPKLQALPPVCKEKIVAAYRHLQACEAKGRSTPITAQKEKFADLFNQSGLHNESRKYYYELIKNTASLVDKSRLLRKVSSSYIAQRQHLQAHATAEEALMVLQRAEENKVEVPELFEALTAAASSNYYIGKAQRLKELVKEMRLHYPAITDKAVRLKFYYVVMMDILLRYRWYMLPEESITHGEFHLQLARETGNPIAIANACNSLGVAHLWREECKPARRYFEEALQVLQNQNFDMALMAQIYTAVSYRMQNNIAMTEHWATNSMDVAKRNKNQLYIGFTYGNVAWVHAKRSNWLYAEDYARKGLELLKPYRQPMLWLCIFPLLECLYKTERCEEAGIYCYMLTHPSCKGLPPTVSEKIMHMNAVWADNRTHEMAICLEEVVAEAKLTNYF